MITLLLSHPDMQVAGIQATIRSVGEAPERAGRLFSSNLNTIVNGGITYLNHARPLLPVSGKVTVTLVWNVPDVIETTIFNAAMVAANNDLSPFGDTVVKIEKTIEIVAK